MKSTDTLLRRTGLLAAGALVTVLLAAAGCGKGSASGGPPGDFPISAVIAPVTNQVIEEKIFLVGSLASIEAVDIVSEVDAAVVEIAFEEGEPVAKGDVLIRLDDRKLAAAVAEAQARFDLAKTNLERSANLLQRDTIARQDYDQARAEYDSSQALLNLATERLSDATIRAPFDGVMTERLVSIGQYLSRGQVLASLVEMDPLEAEFNVPERYIGQLNRGQSIEITVEAFTGKRFPGEVVFISPTVDRASRTVLVKARISNAERLLKPGMFGRLELLFRAREGALVIPEAAISYNRDQASVVVMNAGGKAEFRNVQVGMRVAGQAEITAGLQAGERVVVEGFQKMRPGSTILISTESAKYGITPEAPAAQ